MWLIPIGAIAVAAYVNVANFMDGINGISGTHGLLVGGFYAYAGYAAGHGWMVYVGIAIALAFAGFLPWNLSRNKVFLVTWAAICLVPRSRLRLCVRSSLVCRWSTSSHRC
ncbi:hypothetical protein NHF46_15135 [Arthrobacter alpinus]|nr:hypothetical protein [Arthrobacter alpinus]